MKTRYMIRSSAAALATLCLAGCDTVVIMQNTSSAGVFLLAPGEVIGFVDLLEPGQTREAEVAPGPTLFEAFDENGETLATRECDVPPPNDNPTFAAETFVVTWTGTEITCELVFDNPESAGGGTAGRLIPSGVFWPPAAPK
jgi:hypothetical protein